jgi:hypothetical protein
MGIDVTDPGPDPVTGIDPWPSIANAINNAAIQARRLVADMNANALAIYMNNFNNWALSVVNGKIDNTNPPQPPMAWVIVTDATTGLANAVVGTTPVCPLPPIPPSHVQTQPTPPPNNIDIGTCILIGTTPSAYYRVGPMDSWPIGKETPPGAQSADGAVGVFLRLGTAVGAGWWEKVG